MKNSTIKEIKDLSSSDVALAGGKGASLGEMTRAGVPVPPGFVILATAFEKFLKETDLGVEIDSILHSVNHNEIHTVENASEKIKALILRAKIPQDIAKEIQKFFKNLNSKYVAVRSSATAEDSASAAWAGQLESYLNTTKENLLENVKKCWASLFTPRAIFYRFEKDLHKQKISVAVVVQRMVESEKSGIAFSVHPVTQDKNQLIIEAGFGLGEAIVSGQITPDSYVVEKQPRRIIDKNVQIQTKGLYRARNGGNEWRDIPKERGEKQVLSDKEILELSELILKIENHYRFPCDIEWTFEKDKFYIIQSRPITTLKQIITQEKKSSIGLNLSEWEFEFQQRDGHPLIMADQWCKSLYNNFVQEINLGIRPYDYIFTGIYRGYVKTKQKKDALQKFFKAAEDQKYLNYVFERTMGRVKELVDFSIIVRDKPLNTNKDLLKDWRNFNALFSKVIPWFYIPYYLSEKDFLTNKVKEGLKKYASAISEITDMNNALGLLCSPTKNNKLQDEQEALYKLVKFAVENKNYESDAKFNHLADAYLDDFAWIKTFIELPKEPLSRKELLEKISESINSGFVEQFELQKNQKEKNQKIVERILEIVKKNKVLLKSIENARYLGWILSASVEDSLMATANLIPFYKKIAQALNVSYENWVHFTIDEIENLLNEETLNISLDDRKMSYVYIMENGERKMHFGAIAKEYTEDIDTALNKVDTNVSEFSGNPTSPGVVRGKVRITLNPDESKNVLDGEILVCGMTSPDYVPAMKRAGAIVTDEGGILSHAAIISRELGKPCVVGTKVATKVLKSGYLVEVDANKGIIKILQNS